MKVQQKRSLPYQESLHTIHIYQMFHYDLINKVNYKPLHWCSFHSSMAYVIITIALTSQTIIYQVKAVVHLLFCIDHVLLISSLCLLHM